MGTWHDMVDGQLPTCRDDAAVLTGLFVTHDDAVSGAWEFEVAGDADVAGKPDDERDCIAPRDPAHEPLGGFDDFGFFLEQQDERTPRRDQLQWFVTRV
jgi:hypothetical protein